MAEDWRATVLLRQEADSGRFVSVLHSHGVDAEALARLGNHVAVSNQGDRVFLYADSESAMREAASVASDLLAAQGMQAEVRLDRWHHEEERWEDASVSLPRTEAELSVEHERLEQAETSESRATGVAEWEVRIDLASHHDAIAMATQLDRDGFSNVVRRWKFLQVGTEDKDEAEALAAKLETELPAGAVLHVEPGSGTVWRSMPSNPFAVFGGLGG